MKIIKLFIASSINDFRDERIFIGNFIQKFNADINSDGICVKLFLCEDESTNCQSIYDRKIEECNIFIALINDKIGPYTLHEIEVANRAKSISDKIIIWNDNIPMILNDERFSLFNIYHISTDNLLIGLCDLIKEKVKIITPNIVDYGYEYPTTLFKLKRPDSTIDTIENAIIGNIIRGFNDQYDDKFHIVEEDSYQESDASVSILNIASENELCYLGKSCNIENILTSLWLFINESGTNSIQVEEIIKMFQDEYGLYPDTYNLNFELIFQNKLFKALIDYGLLEGFKYIIEDHLLIKETLLTGKQYIVKNLSGLCDEKKERTIQNILNLYCLNNKKQQYIKALEQLHNSNFDFFGYNQYIVNDLQKYLPNRAFYEAVVDFVTDSLENLQLGIYNIEENELNEEISMLLGTFHNNALSIKNEDALYIYYCIGNLYYAKDLIDKTEKYLCQVLRTYDNILQNNPDDIESEIVLQATLDLCAIYFKRNDNNKILDVVQNQLKIPLSDGNYQHEIFKIRLYIYQARACYGVYKKELSEKAYLLAKDALERNNYRQNDMLLDIYIQLIYEYLINTRYFENFNIDEKLVNNVVDLYNRYLSANNTYELTGKFVEMLLAVKNNDRILAYKTIQEIRKKNILNTKDCIYLDTLYLYAHILHKSKEYEKEIEVYKLLIGQYPGGTDNAICLQNQAWCYMSIDCENKLQKAEKAFRSALNIFESIDSSGNNTCNIHDGLAYCYILQQKFQLAEESAKKAIDIGNYTNLNNLYSNFISSLLCQKKYRYAWKIFHKECTTKCNMNELQEQLQKDWSEMNECGIKTTFFNLLIICHCLIENFKHHKQNSHVL